MALLGMSKSRVKRNYGAGHRYTKSPALADLIITKWRWKNDNSLLSGAMYAGDIVAVSEQDLRL